MDNSVLTECGKEIELCNRFGNMSWKMAATQSREVIEKTKRHKMNTEIFDNRTPSVGTVEDAVVSQLPLEFLLEGKHENFYILNKLNYSPSRIEINEEDLKLIIPNGCWNNLDIPEEFVESFAYLVDSNKNSSYMDKDFNKIESVNIDSFLMAFYRDWAILYRIKKLPNSKHQVLTTVMQNSNTNCKNLEEKINNTKILTKERYRTVTHKNDNVVVLGGFEIRSGGLSSKSLKKLPESPCAYQESLMAD